MRDFGRNKWLLTSVPRSIGLFMNAHAAKWVLASVKVKSLRDVHTLDAIYLNLSTHGEGNEPVANFCR